MNQEFLNSLGVVDWGYTEDPRPTSFAEFEHWVNSGSHGPLGYLADHRKPLRQDLRNVFPEFQSALVFLFSYKETKKWMIEENRHEVAAYTLGFGGHDYHHELRRRLSLIADTLGEVKSTISLDIQPVLERDLAYRAGLGWFGKNSMLINQREGSYFIIGSLLLDRKLPYEVKKLETDHCGHCTLCIEACPTQAIHPESRTLEASKCISTFTIELYKDAPVIPGMEKSRDEIFGCDICQDVCPWNRKPITKAKPLLHLDERFSFLREWFYQWPKEKLNRVIEDETNRGLKKKLSGTPFDRPGRIGWLKNLKRFKP